jgi:hypothetical protein
MNTAILTIKAGAADGSTPQGSRASLGRWLAVTGVFLASLMPVHASERESPRIKQGGFSWVQQYPFPESSTVLALALSEFGGVALGANGGLSRISDDYYTWETMRYQTPQALTPPLSWTGRQFVCAGAAGGLLTSVDGAEWTLRLPNSTNRPLALANSDSVHVAVGANGLILTSPDAMTWQRVSSGLVAGRGSSAVDSLEAVVWTGSQFIAAGGRSAASGVILTSPDARTWTIQRSRGMGKVLALGWNGTQMLATTATGRVWRSTDGQTWVGSQPVLSDGHGVPFSQVVWNGNQWIATGVIASQAVLFPGRTAFSSDGILWTIVAQHAPYFSLGAPAAPAWNGVSTVAGGLGGLWHISAFEPNKWSPSSTTPDYAVGILPHFNSIVWTGKRLVAAGRDRGPRVHLSDDGVRWEPAPFLHPDDFEVQDMIWTGSQILMLTDWDSGCAPNFLTSRDGLTWDHLSVVFSETEGCFQKLGWNGRTVMTIAPEGKVASSPDGIAWTQKGSIENEGALSDIGWNGSRWIVSTGRGIAMSPDGTRWTCYRDPAPTGKPFQCVSIVGRNAYIFSDDRTAIVAANQRPVFIKGGGPDALAWNGRTAVGISGNPWPNGPAEDMPEGSIMESADGITWPSSPLKRHPLSARLKDIVWAGNQFVAVGSYGTILTLKSRHPRPYHR